MKSWVKELLCIALSAAFFAAVLPRVVLPPLASAQRVPARLRTAPRDEPPTPTTVSAEGPTALAAAPEPLAESPDLAPSRASRRLRGSARGPAAPPLPPGLSYVDHRWVADLRVLPPPRVALAGASIAPPGEGGTSEGYRVTSTDRLGLFHAVGIAPGDVLVSVEGMPLRSPDDALDALSRLRGASRATFVFQRGATRYQVPVELVGRPEGRPLAL